MDNGKSVVLFQGKEAQLATKTRGYPGKKGRQRKREPERETERESFIRKQCP
jgi:hypothetical protein